ncbi:MAG: methyltransferase family protein [Thermoproteota archaeon]
MNFINSKFIVTAFFNEFPILAMVAVQREEILSISIIRLVLGSFLLLVSFLIFAKSALDYIRCVSKSKGKTFASQGAFSKVRFPLVLCMILANLGFAILFFSLFILVLTLLFVPAWVIVCRSVDKELYKKFGFKYYDYKKKVPMILPIKISLPYKIFET